MVRIHFEPFSVVNLVSVEKTNVEHCVHVCLSYAISLRYADGISICILIYQNKLIQFRVNSNRVGCIM